MQLVAVVTNAALRVKVATGEIVREGRQSEGPNSEHPIAWAVPPPAPVAQETQACCACVDMCVYCVHASRK